MALVRVTRLVPLPSTQLTLECGHTHGFACENMGLALPGSEQVESPGGGGEDLDELGPAADQGGGPCSSGFLSLPLCSSDRMTFPKRRDSFFKGTPGAALSAGTWHQSFEVICRRHAHYLGWLSARTSPCCLNSGGRGRTVCCSRPLFP